MSPEMRLLEDTILSGQPVSVPKFLSTWLAEPKPLWIGGEAVHTNRTFETLAPATGEPLARVALGDADEVDRAVKAATAAFESGTWARSKAGERAAVLESIAETILAHRPALALLESLDTGKPITESYHGDILRAAENFRFFAGAIRHEESPCYPSTDALHFAFREPLGVAALVTPWNLPLYLETWKLAPCLAMGNSCVLKPSELTPLTAAYLFDRVLPECDLPRGIANLVHGFGENAAGERLVSHPGIGAISFTGETSTGRAIMRAAAVGPHRVSFELGGKGATVVFGDADLDRAVATSVRAAFRNQGEICLACPRVYVADSVYDEFRDRFLRAVSAIRVGDPLCLETQMGALISEGHLEKVEGYLRDLPDGAVLHGGERRDPGYFLSPAVVENVPAAHRICREEVFGPVVTLHRFADEREVVAAVNGTPYGLSASVWTRDLERAHRVARAVRSGLVWINTWFLRDLRVPFGGQGRSGVGREGGRHSLDFFSEWKSVGMALGEST